MHPDAIITGLRSELERYPERKQEIEAEIRAVDRQARPAALPESPVLVADPDREYLAGLGRELERAGKDRHDEIRAEIKRVTGLIERRDGNSEEASVASDEPSAAEIEQRRQARTGQRVERATNEPGGRPVVSSAPAQGAEKEQS